MNTYQVQAFLSQLTAAFGKNMRPEQRSVWEQRLLPIDISDHDAQKVLSGLQTYDDFPSLGAVIRSLFAAAVRQNAVEPVWKTSLDSQGRSWAKKTGVLRSVLPPVQEIERWRIGMAAPSEARESFLQGFTEAGGDPVRFAEMFRALTEADDSLVVPF